MSVGKGAITAVRSVSTLLDHTTATVSVAFSESMAQSVKVCVCVFVCVITGMRSTRADVNECKVLSPNGFCSQVCNNTEGSFHCDCMEGYQLFRSFLCTGLYIALTKKQVVDIKHLMQILMSAVKGLIHAV